MKKLKFIETLCPALLFLALAGCMSERPVSPDVGKGDVVEHIAIEVEDPAQMVDWWVKNLGFRITLRREKGSTFIVDGSGRLAFEVYGPQPGHAAPDYRKMSFMSLHFGFVSTDVAADERRLVAAGATVVVRENAPGLEGFVARDPWGIPIQFLKRVKGVLAECEGGR